MSSRELPWTRAVVIEDDRGLAARLRHHLSSRRIEANVAFGAVDGVDRIRSDSPDLVLLDYKLPDGNAREIIQQLADLSPWPTFVVISGQAEPLDTFQLAELGVHAYVQKPMTPASLDAALKRAATPPVGLTPALRRAVGHIGVREVEHLARRTMVQEALARARGSRSGAARLLGMSRQLLQHVIRR